MQTLSFILCSCHYDYTTLQNYKCGQSVLRSIFSFHNQLVSQLDQCIDRRWLVSIDLFFLSFLSLRGHGECDGAYPCSTWRQGPPLAREHLGLQYLAQRYLGGAGPGKFVHTGVTSQADRLSYCRPIDEFGSDFSGVSASVRWCNYEITTRDWKIQS